MNAVCLWISWLTFEQLSKHLPSLGRADGPKKPIHRLFDWLVSLLILLRGQRVTSLIIVILPG